MRRLTIVVLVLAVVTAACGSDDGDEAGSAGTTAATTATGGAPVELSGKVNDEGTEDATGASSVEMEADDFSFKPTFIKVTAGQTLTIELKNEGEANHTFTSAALDIDHEVGPGRTASVEVTLPAAEAVLFVCRFHQGGGMQGAFYTREGATVGAAPSGGSGGY